MRCAGSERKRHGAAAPALSAASARLHTAADVSVSGERMQWAGVAWTFLLVEVTRDQIR